MKITKTFYAKDRKEWRAWLSKNYNTEKEIWLIYFNKKSGRPRVSYNDAVEEALCYGWIDSILKNINDLSYAQRFSPRRKNSQLSEANKERIRKLIKNRKMTKHGLFAVSKLFDKKKEMNKKLNISSDILNALKSNKKAWQNFQKFDDSYKRVRIGYIESRRGNGKEQFLSSLNNFIKMTEKNKKFGFMR